jgi:ketosteroid isomerase-like protein
MCIPSESTPWDHPGRVPEMGRLLPNPIEGLPNTMKKITLALASLFIAGLSPVSAQTPSSPEAAVMAVANQFLDGFNKGDEKAMLAAGSDQMSIIDEFPPHEWHGAGSFAKWLADYDIDAKRNGITDAFVTFGKASHVDVTGDDAYIVLSADYAFKRNGKPEAETGSILTISLHKGPDGWRMTGWAWAKH